MKQNVLSSFKIPSTYISTLGTSVSLEIALFRMSEKKIHEKLWLLGKSGLRFGESVEKLAFTFTSMYGFDDFHIDFV